MRRAVASVLVATALSGAAAAQTPAPAQPLVPPPALSGPYVVVVEQIVTRPLAPAILEQMKPLKTLLQVEELLKTNSIPFQWQRATFDPAKTNPQLLAQIQGLPPGEVFVIPAPDRVYINRIIGRADAPKPTP